MCFDPVTIGLAVASAAITAGTSAVSGYMQTKAQNQAAVQQYKYEQQQQKMVNDAAVENFNESLSRQRVEQLRSAQQSSDNAQQSILENQRRQASAVANAATSGITGTPLSMLFNEYQVSTGNVANNLQTNYQQLNENYFFNADSIRRENQSRINQSIPAQPYLASFSILPSLLQGASSGMGVLAGGYTPKAGGGTTGTTSSAGNAAPLPPVFNPNGLM